MTSLAPILESFFTERLITQRRASPHTIASYRDTFRLLLGFAETEDVPIVVEDRWRTLVARRLPQSGMRV